MGADGIQRGLLGECGFHVEQSLHASTYPYKNDHWIRIGNLHLIHVLRRLCYLAMTLTAVVLWEHLYAACK